MRKQIRHLPEPRSSRCGAGADESREHRLAAARALLAAESVGSAGAPDRETHLAQLCRVVSRTLPAMGAAVTLMTAEGLQSGAIASDRRTQVLEEQQFSFGEGPCVDAFAFRRPVLEPNLDHGGLRWAAYAPAAIEQGVQAVFAFPLQVGASRLGVLDIYRDAPGGLASHTLVQALTFAEVALRILLDGQAQAADTEPVGGLETAVESRAELFQAQGMVMIQLGVSLAEAMSRLRAHAFVHNRKLGDVARDVVARRLAFTPDQLLGDSA